MNDRQFDTAIKIYRYFVKNLKEHRASLNTKKGSGFYSFEYLHATDGFIEKYSFSTPGLGSSGVNVMVKDLITGSSAYYFKIPHYLDEKPKEIIYNEPGR